MTLELKAGKFYRDQQGNKYFCIGVMPKELDPNQHATIVRIGKNGDYWGVDCFNGKGEYVCDEPEPENDLVAEWGTRLPHEAVTDELFDAAVSLLEANTVKGMAFPVKVERWDRLKAAVTAARKERE